MSDPSISTNPTASNFDASGDSPEYRAFKARLDAYEMWEAMSHAERLTMILDRFPAEDWYRRDPHGTDNLSTLAHFWKDDIQRAVIEQRFKDIGGNPWNLKKAVEAVLAEQQAAQADAPGRDLDETRARQRPAVTTMDTVETQPITWGWWPYFAVGNLCMLVGDPGVGKSLLMTQLAASLSRGFPLPDQQGQPTLATDGPHATLLLSTEDGLADTLKPRLIAADADCSKVHVLTGWLGPEDKLHAFTLQHMGVLEEAIKCFQPLLVVIDPIQAYLGKIDMHRANETRPLLAALARLAEQYHCAIVCVQHPSKGGGNGVGKAIYRGLGSIDFIGAARSGLFVEQHPVDPGKAILFHHKSNLGALGRPQVFSKSEGQFRWCGVTRLSVELVAGERRGPDPMAFLEAFCWLEHRLKDGLAWSASDIETEATEKADIAKGTLARAKKALGVISTKGNSADAVWTWRLPPPGTCPPPDIYDFFGIFGILRYFEFFDSFPIFDSCH